jgi:hypothetical protein
MRWNQALKRESGTGLGVFASLLMAGQVSLMACSNSSPPEFDVKVGMAMDEFSAQKGAQAVFGSDIVERGRKDSMAGTETSLRANVILPKGNYVINFSKRKMGFFGMIWTPLPKIDGNFYVSDIMSPISPEELDFFKAKEIAEAACDEIKGKINLTEDMKIYNPSITDVETYMTINTTSICNMTDKSEEMEILIFLEHSERNPSIFAPNIWIRRPMSYYD